MKTNRYIPVWVVVAVLIMLSSCVKDILYNTPHPESGAVVLMLEGAPDGEVFVAGIDGQTADMDGLPFTWPELLKPGDYSLVVHNRAEGFAFDGRTARVDAEERVCEDGEVAGDHREVPARPRAVPTFRAHAVAHEELAGSPVAPCARKPHALELRRLEEPRLFVWSPASRVGRFSHGSSPPLSSVAESL